MRRTPSFNVSLRRTTVRGSAASSDSPRALRTSDSAVALLEAGRPTEGVDEMTLIEEFIDSARSTPGPARLYFAYRRLNPKG